MTNLYMVDKTLADDNILGNGRNVISIPRKSNVSAWF